MADIFTSLEKAKEQAKDYGHSIIREVAFLSVHGYLHLSGYDHQTKEDEKIMFAKQDEILNKAGIKR
jgi:probable rRNA maturation factor